MVADYLPAQGKKGGKPVTSFMPGMEIRARPEAYRQRCYVAFLVQRDGPLVVPLDDLLQKLDEVPSINSKQNYLPILRKDDSARSELPRSIS